jgi:hypothetical protein
LSILTEPKKRSIELLIEEFIVEQIFVVPMMEGFTMTLSGTLMDGQNFSAVIPTNVTNCGVQVPANVSFNATLQVAQGKYHIFRLFYCKKKNFQDSWRITRSA